MAHRSLRKKLQGAAHRAALKPHYYPKVRGVLVAVIALGLAVVALGGSAAYLLLHSQGKATTMEPWPEASEQVYDDGFPEVDWDWWQSVNPDVIGWVTVPGTVIDYPVVQAPADDPDYYLKHDVYGEENFYGCPYLDAACADAGFDSPVCYIFGHHLDDGTMFSAFASYADRAFAEGHREVLLQTPTQKYRLQVVVADVINAGKAHKKVDFSVRAEFEQWAEEAIANADVNLLEDATDQIALAQGPNSGIKVFVTCSYTTWRNERTLVYCF